MATSPFNKQLSNRNFLSPVGFEFSLAKYPKVSFFCNSAKIPQITLQTVVQSSYLKQLDIPSDQLDYSDLTLRFLVDEELVNYVSIHNWLTSLGFPETAQQYADMLYEDQERDPLNFFSDGTLTILNSNYRPQVQIKFKDLFPVSLTSLDFTATDTDINYFTAEVSFKYTVYNILTMQNKLYEP
jgi:hypothetical protein